MARTKSAPAAKKGAAGKPRANKRRAEALVEEAEADEKELASIDLVLPISRVSKVIRSDKDVNKVNREALFAIARCTEIFVGALAEQSAAAVSRDLRKIIQYKDLTDVLSEQPTPSYNFLTDELAVDTPAPAD